MITSTMHPHPHSRPSKPMPEITVVDAIMGSGKTTWMMKKLEDEVTRAKGRRLLGEVDATRYIYVAPLLKEVERVIRSCPTVGFRQPLQLGCRKADHLLELLASGENICTTHALFRALTPEHVELVRRRRYVLIIDEALTTVEEFKITPGDRKLLFGGGLMRVGDDRGRLTWNDAGSSAYYGKFSTERGLCIQGSLHQSPAGPLIWEFPISALEPFAEVFVLTYLFEGSLMESWFRSHGVRWARKTVHEGRLMDRSAVDDRPRLAQIARNLEIYDGESNRVGSPRQKPGARRSQPLSSSWLKRDSDNGYVEAKKLRGAATYYFRTVAKTKSRVNAWTTFKDHREALQGEGYTRGFIPVNARATNEHAHKTSLAYLANIFPLPVLANHCAAGGLPFNAEAYALSEMVQWIWRSAIRNDEPVELFIPSERMRGLLLTWLETGRAPQPASG
ncbi:hypothetical protein SAMN05444336_1048 [Albimonas donghaensis]|uniref:Uncharacterized protein n=1 Tax=Albimonas donghaensis TaxID=356660 RepID=A0A1H3A0P4_9RHOB|nr:DEAD/DEAH box helicase family protein [Albimonas donghaensis]SDX23001.1 hypothetical protein SAMN05444336_1048 [Albimonas donghaensis]